MVNERGRSHTYTSLARGGLYGGMLRCADEGRGPVRGRIEFGGTFETKLQRSLPKQAGTNSTRIEYKYFESADLGPQQEVKARLVRAKRNGRITRSSRATDRRAYGCNFNKLVLARALNGKDKREDLVLITEFYPEHHTTYFCRGSSCPPRIRMARPGEGVERSGAKDMCLFSWLLHSSKDVILPCVL